MIDKAELRLSSCVVHLEFKKQKVPVLTTVFSFFLLPPALPPSYPFLLDKTQNINPSNSPNRFLHLRNRSSNSASQPNQEQEGPKSVDRSNPKRPAPNPSCCCCPSPASSRDLAPVPEYPHLWSMLGLGLSLIWHQVAKFLDLPRYHNTCML